MNAAQASKPGGIIQVTTAYAPPEGHVLTHAVLVVEDGGSGMSPATLAHALDPFFTTHPERMGLGLSIAHALAEQADGSLRIESELGVGTRVIVGLPLDRTTDRIHSRAVWPVPHALHDIGVLGEKSEGQEIRDYVDPQEDGLPIWREEISRKLARGSTVAVGLLALTSLLLVPSQ